MKITEGLLDHIVVQRTRRGMSDATFGGRCSVAGAVVARVRRGGKTVRPFDWTRVGRAERGRFAGRLRGLAAGGPYDVELRIVRKAGKVLDRTSVRDVLVGDVWILGGQSNMQGVGLLSERLRAIPQVRAFYMDDRWGPAEDPIHNLHAAVDQVHVDLAGGVRPAPPTVTGVGPGVAFGQGMFRATGVPQGLIACAHGGTSMAQWDPKLNRLGGCSLYGAMLRRFRKNGSRVAGMVWYQGESDATPEAAPLYTQRMKALVRAMRRHFGDRRLPVVVVQVSRVVSWPWSAEHWNSIQDQQQRLGEVVDNLATVPAIDLSLDDSVHIGGRDQHRLGHRLARAMQVLLHGRRAGKAPIALNSVSVQNRPRDGLADLVVEFTNVEGRLSAGSRAAGFALRDPGPATPFYNIELEANKAIIHTMLPGPDLEAMQVQYGCGCDPYCNIMDAAGRSLPAFAPQAIGRPRALTEFVREFLVSSFLPADGKLRGLEYPGALDMLGLERRAFPDRFCARTEEILKSRGQQGVYYYGCRFECPERMRVRALLGYDGPVKVWADGREVFHDPEGTNPASALDAEAALGALSAGQHELLIALGNNNGNAWGIFLRLQRTDVPLWRIRQGPGAYAMPSVLA